MRIAEYGLARNELVASLRAGFLRASENSTQGGPQGIDSTNQFRPFEIFG
jgi:hypothetical protein